MSRCGVTLLRANMSRHGLLLSLLLMLPLAASADTIGAATADTGQAAQWWSDLSALADDGMEGRLTGSPGYDRAAAYVISRLKAEGLKPAGVNGYLQPVSFEQQVVDQEASKAALTGQGATMPLKVGDIMLITAGGGRRPAHIDAPLVFIGYGLHLPGKGYDDFEGLDLKGKIAVVLSGGPADISGSVKSNARSF